MGVCLATSGPGAGVGVGVRVGVVSCQITWHQLSIQKPKMCLGLERHIGGENWGDSLIDQNWVGRGRRVTRPVCGNRCLHGEHEPRVILSLTCPQDRDCGIP